MLFRSRKAVSRWLLTPNRLAIRFTPITARHGDTPEPDRKSPPQLQPEKPFPVPQIQTAKLSNGLQVYVVERHDLAKVAVVLRFRLGSAYDPPNKPGVALLAMATDSCGTTTLTESEIEQEKSRLALDLHGDADSRSQDARFEVLRRNLDPALQLFADLLLHPTYPPDVFERQKSDIVGGLEETIGRIDNYENLATAVAFGAKHPLGIAATPETLRSIKIPDIQEFQKRYWRPDAAVLVFAGDITLADAVGAAKKHFDEWSGAAGLPQTLPPPDPMPGRIFLSNRPGATQTMLTMILPGIPRNDPDGLALFVANEIWGGGGYSRLYRDIRLQRGIAYGANAGLSILPGYGLWIAHSPVQADKTREAMAAFTKELRDLAGDRPITQEELDGAKQDLIRGYPSQFQDLLWFANSLSENWSDGLTLADFAEWPQRIGAITRDQVNTVARKYARPEKAVFLLLGDRDKIGPIDGMVIIK